MFAIENVHCCAKLRNKPFRPVLLPDCVLLYTILPENLRKSGACTLHPCKACYQLGCTGLVSLSLTRSRASVSYVAILTGGVLALHS